MASVDSAGHGVSRGPVTARSRVRAAPMAERAFTRAPRCRDNADSLVASARMSRTESRLSQLWAHEKASYGLRVFIALGVVMAVCWSRGTLLAIPSLFLGIIASALAETDDNWWGRTKSVLLSLLWSGSPRAPLAVGTTRLRRTTCRLLQHHSLQVIDSLSSTPDLQ